MNGPRRGAQRPWLQRSASVTGPGAAREARGHYLTMNLSPGAVPRSLAKWRRARKRGLEQKWPHGGQRHAAPILGGNPSPSPGAGRVPGCRLRPRPLPHWLPSASLPLLPEALPDPAVLAGEPRAARTAAGPACPLLTLYRGTPVSLSSRTRHHGSVLCRTSPTPAV